MHDSFVGFGAARTRRHTLKAGETLWTVAVAHYGNANAAFAVAQANGIRNFRTVAVGTVLKLPELKH